MWSALSHPHLNHKGVPLDSRSTYCDCDDQKESRDSSQSTWPLPCTISQHGPFVISVVHIDHNIMLLYNLWRKSSLARASQPALSVCKAFGLQTKANCIYRYYSSEQFTGPALVPSMYSKAIKCKS